MNYQYIINMNELTNFEFEGNALRVLDINGEPWFVATDVCAALNIANEQTRRLDKDEKGLRLTQTPGGQQEMIVINESGLYSLILGSRKPIAKPFKKWVTSEVLPAIRKTGSYITKPLSPAEALHRVTGVLVEVERRQLTLEAEQKRQGEQQFLLEQKTDQTNQRLDQIETASDHFTVLGYMRHVKGESIPLAEAAKLGRQASIYCKQHEVETGEVPDPRFGRVKTYPKWVLDNITKTVN